MIQGKSYKYIGDIDDCRNKIFKCYESTRYIHMNMGSQYPVMKFYRKTFFKYWKEIPTKNYIKKTNWN